MDCRAQEELSSAPSYSQSHDEMDLEETRTDSGVEALRQEVEKLQRAPKDDHEAAKTGIAGLDLEAIDPKILLEYADRRIREQFRSTTLVGHRQLSNWNGSYFLTKALETSAAEEAYEKVKEVALRLERSIKIAEDI
ncbi:unnamed protein product [Heligmosomoides polygyrus]|uniref:Uncharacterized protein n=1 Tax=Heligmosomoides polygyrus TaxID=6339 RepID=A0A183FUU9_HELPZ|nr:unnamed protein product [Heligmosomoides polygyrus]